MQTVMDRVPLLFVEEIACHAGVTDLKELQQQSGAFGRVAEEFRTNRFDLILEMFIAQPNDFKSNNLGVYKSTVKPKKKLEKGESALQYVIENHKYLSKLIIDVGIDDSKHEKFASFGESFLHELAMLYPRSRAIQMIVANENAENTPTEMQNLRFLFDKFAIPKKQPNLEVKIEWPERRTQLAILEFFLARHFRAIQFNDQWDYGSMESLIVDIFFRPSFEKLGAAKDHVLPAIVERWHSTTAKDTSKCFLSSSGAHFYDSEAFFEGFNRANVTWSKKGFRKSLEWLAISQHLRAIHENVSFHGDQVCRFLYKKHPQIANFFLCLLFVTSVSKIQECNEEEDTLATAKLKKFAEKMKNHEFAQCSEEVCLFFCEGERNK